MDTGAFQFPNTTPAVLRCAARLTAGGADFATVMDRLFYHEPLGRRRLAARLLEQLRFACSGRLAYACLLPAWLEELGVEPADTEGLIDSLRVLDGVDMVCLLQPEADGVRLSLRARRRAWPADRVAHALGGGGHPLAAGARLRGATLAEAEARLLQETGKTFKP
jgi:phosphoesterase RecJ-like protein